MLWQNENTKTISELTVIKKLFCTIYVGLLAKYKGYAVLNHCGWNVFPSLQPHTFSDVAGVFFASTGTFLQPVLQTPGFFQMLIISISVVCRVKIEIILLQFQLIYMISIWESQPSAVLIYVLNKEMFNAPEGALGTRDRQ